MKANTPELMKFKRLQRRLNDTRRGIVGLLESLWIGVAKNCPEGDVGRFTDEEIAIMVDWEGDPETLIEALVECRWLDRCDTHRLVIHDWAEHCPTYVRGGLAKQKKEPIGTTYRYNLDSSEDKPIGSAKGTTSEVPSTIPSLTKPNQAKPSERGNDLASPPPESPLSHSSHSGSNEFRTAWDLWLSKQRSGTGRAMDPNTELLQLKSLEQFDTPEAIAVVEFSVSRTNCKNLITNGDHKKRAGPKAKLSNEELFSKIGT